MLGWEESFPRQVLGIAPLPESIYFQEENLMLAYCAQCAFPHFLSLPPFYTHALRNVCHCLQLPVPKYSAARGH